MPIQMFSGARNISTPPRISSETDKIRFVRGFLIMAAKTLLSVSNLTIALNRKNTTKKVAIIFLCTDQ